MYVFLCLAQVFFWLTKQRNADKHLFFSSSFGNEDGKKKKTVRTTMLANLLVRSTSTYPVQQPLKYLTGTISCPLPSIAGSPSKELLPAEAVLDDDACTEML